MDKVHGLVDEDMYKRIYEKIIFCTRNIKSALPVACHNSNRECAFIYTASCFTAISFRQRPHGIK